MDDEPRGQPILHSATFATKIVAVKGAPKVYCRPRGGGAYFFGAAAGQSAIRAIAGGIDEGMVQISKVPVICRRAFYADLATAGAAVGIIELLK